MSDEWKARLIEEMARAAYEGDMTFDDDMDYVREDFYRMARDALSVALPAIVERCAIIAETFPKNREWVPGSLYDTLRREVAQDIRELR